MFEIASVHSADPALRVLRSRPDELLGQAYAGYALLLFGAADEEIATWFSRQISSLDSLTGDDVACVVFARRVRITATVERRRSTRPARGAHFERDGSVSLSDVREDHGGFHDVSATRLVADDGTSQWSSQPNTIVAVTYAVDDIARTLGIVDKLPCVAFFDGLPSRATRIEDLAKGACVVQIGGQEGCAEEDVIPLLRVAMQHLRSSTGFAGYTSRINRIIKLESEIVRHTWTLDSEQKQHRAIIDLAEVNFEASLKALRDGSARIFEESSKRVPEIDLERVTLAVASVRARQAKLVHCSRTIRSIEWHLLNDCWPLGPELSTSLGVVIERHVSKIVGIVSKGVFESRLSFQEMLEALRKQQTAVIEDALVPLGGLDAWCRWHDEWRHRNDAEFKVRADHFEVAMRDMNTELASLRQELSPSLVASVRAAIRLKHERVGGEPIRNAARPELVPIIVYGDLVQGNKNEISVVDSTIGALAFGDNPHSVGTVNLSAGSCPPHVTGQPSPEGASEVSRKV